MKNTVETEPLRAALANLIEHHEDIVSATKRKDALYAEVEKFVKEGDPRDEEMARLIALRKVQADMMPRFIQKAVEKGPELVDALASEVETLEKALEAAVATSAAAYRADLGKGADALRVNFCPGIVRDAQTGRIGHKSTHESEGLRAQFPEQFEKAIMARAEELLTIAAEFEPYQPGSAKQKIAELFGLKLAK